MFEGMTTEEIEESIRQEWERAQECHCDEHDFDSGCHCSQCCSCSCHDVRGDFQQFRNERYRDLAEYVSREFEKVVLK